MTKEQAIAIITKCAKEYHQNLEGKQICFLYKDRYNHSNFTTVRFHSHNFLHFTGICVRSGMKANDFYRAALNNHLSARDFSFNISHTSELKLKVLEIIMNIDTNARMIGNYSGPHVELYTEKIAGNVNASLGLIHIKDYYVPNSVLNEDIRSIIPKPPGKIYAILKKSIKDKVYRQITYKSSKIPLCIPTELLNTIDKTILSDIQLNPLTKENESGS